MRLMGLLFHYQLLTGSSYLSPILFCAKLVSSRRYETLTILLSLCLALVYQLDTSFILGLNADLDYCAELVSSPHYEPLTKPALCLFPELLNSSQRCVLRAIFTNDF
nr:MAG TPA: hypothetical protein [Caudoviricetes sp.]